MMTTEDMERLRDERMSYMPDVSDMPTNVLRIEQRMEDTLASQFLSKAALHKARSLHYLKELQVRNGVGVAR